MSEPDIHLKKFQKELSAGTVSLALLAVLARAGEPLYGYLLAKQLERVGDGAILLLPQLLLADLADLGVEHGSLEPARPRQRADRLGGQLAHRPGVDGRRTDHASPARTACAARTRLVRLATVSS